MTTEAKQTDDSLIDQLLADAVAQGLAGGAVDIEAIVAGHKEREAEIRGRWSDLEKLSMLWRKATSASGPAGLGESMSPGSALGEFRILRELGRGGMGVVYLAEQPALARQVALKVIPPTALSKHTRERFLREARALAALSHPNIVPVYTAGEEDGTLYIAMEYVRGVPLSDVIRGLRERGGEERPSAVWDALVKRTSSEDSAAGALTGGSVAEETTGGPPVPHTGEEPPVPCEPVAPRDKDYFAPCLRVIAEVARALGEAHRHGVIHRDVKPSNILVEPSGRARLLDFGLAALGTEPHVTLTGEFFGTPHYVSPEQAAGRKGAAGPPADIYSLGAVLYECVTLRPPLDGASVPEVLCRVLQDDPPPAARINPAVPRDLDTIIAKSLAKEASGRYASMDDMAGDIDRFLAGEPIRARRTNLPQRMARRIRRRPLISALSAAVILAGAAIAILLGTRPPRPAPPVPHRTVRIHCPEPGVLEHGKDMVRTGPYEGGELRVPAAQPVEVRFHADGPLIAGRRVRATKVARAAGHSAADGTIKAQRDDPTTLPVFATGPIGMPDRPLQYEVQWDDRPGTEWISSPLLVPVDVPPAFESFTLQPEAGAGELSASDRAKATSVCYWPRSGQAPALGVGWVEPPGAGDDRTREARARALSLISAFEMLAIRTGPLMQLGLEVDLSAPAGQSPRLAWDWVFESSGVRIHTRGSTDMIYRYSVVIMELPLGPAGEPVKFVVDNGRITQSPDLMSRDYAEAIRACLRERGLASELSRKTSTTPEGWTEFWETQLQPAGAVMFLRPEPALPTTTAPGAP